MANPTVSSINNGIFTVGGSGKVNVNYLYDGDWYSTGEVAVFSLKGMENLQVGSTAFLQEAARRALSNSTSGYVVIKDQNQGAKFTDLKKELTWEPNYNSGTYLGNQSFTMAANDKFAMMYVTSGTVAGLLTNTATVAANTTFSFGSINPTTGQVYTQMADVTGKGNTFGWENGNRATSTTVDRDFNDLVFQIQGATTTTSLLNSEINSTKEWRNSTPGKQLIEYSNRNVFDNGTFKVDSTGQVKFDYLFDGGWFQGELAAFSVKGMETYTPGSVEFIKEAARRALSNSNQGRILAQDATEGARFQAQVGWENNFNKGDYQGTKTFNFAAGDEVAFMMTQNVSIQALYQDPNLMYQWGKLPIFSVAEANPYGNAPNQLVAVDNHGTFAFDDTRIDKGQSDKDYNDMVFQVRGLQANNVASMNSTVNPTRDWRTQTVGKQILSHSNIARFDTGVFEVGETGQVKLDYLFDGGWFQSQLAVFSLDGMNVYTPGSVEFVQEAAQRALSNSTQGYVVIKDTTEAAKFSDKPTWENNFNTTGSYQGVKTFNMNAGDKFAFMLVQNTTVQDTFNNPTKIGDYGRVPIFSVPELNINGKPQGQIVDADGNGTLVFEDIRVDLTTSDRDYNDFVFQVKGVKGKVESMDKYVDTTKDWRKSQVGQNMKNYASISPYNEGVFKADSTGQVKIDYLFDGGWHEGQVGIFSLKGMDIYQTGSKAFVKEALNRALSNSSQGYVVIDDKSDKARYSATLKWENNFNSTGTYRGQQIFQMNAGETFGLVLIPGGTFNEALTAPNSALKKQPIFSMSNGNYQNQKQFADILTGTKGTIAGFEDIQLNVIENKDRDYNDIVLSIGGSQAIGLTDFDGMVDSNRDWTNTSVGHEILNYFNQVQF